MEKAEAIRLFNEMFPEHFDHPWVHDMPEEEILTELVMDLRTEQPLPLEHAVPDGVSFGFWKGEMAQLRQAFGSVNPYWIPYFENADRVFCAFGWDGLILSFCILEDLGSHSVSGTPLRIAGPGCVGTLPSFQRQGIGLAMVRKATLLLDREGFDLSWISYTHLPGWYSRLGYKPVLTWNGRRGFL